jgi:arginine deiminase
MVTGLKQNKNTLSSLLSGMEFDLPPLPNLYFMRDSAAAFRDGVIISSMAHEVRTPESLMASYVFHYHPEMNQCRIHFDGALREDPGIHVEGGDILVARSDLIVAGISERTTAQAIDEIVIALAREYQEPVTAIAVVLPKKRATIHLDMVFTFLDYHAALVYEPLFTGTASMPVVRISADPKGRTEAHECAGMIDALSREGIDIEPISCGGRDPLLQQREQWLSAANVLAVAPGKIIGYDCNHATSEELSKAGFHIIHAEDLIRGAESIDDHERIFIGIPGVELARGGGGVRCMTMPLRRRTAAGW